MTGEWSAWSKLHHIMRPPTVNTETKYIQGGCEPLFSVVCTFGQAFAY